MKKERKTFKGWAPSLSNKASRAILALALLLGICWPSIRLLAQCMNGGTYDNYICNDQVRTYYSTPLTCTSGHCRYDFNATSNVYTLLYRDATTATYHVNNIMPNYAQVIVSMYDSVNNCTAWMDWTDRFTMWTLPDIQGSIPVCPVVGQTYIYLVQHYGNTNGFFPTETIAYAIQGGTILSTTTTVPNSTFVTDTVKVNWNAAGPHRLIATQLSYTTNVTCSYADTIHDGTSLPPVIQGPTALCGTLTGSYGIGALDPNFNYTWSATNGTIASGQGTQNVTVNWTSSGVLTLTRTSIACGWSSSVTKNVTISASPAPSIALAPSYTGCTGQGLTLHPGTFSTYLWSNFYNTPTITVNAAGTYTITVTNAAGCTASASTSVTFAPAPAPNLGPNQTVCAGTPVTLNPGTFSSYVWSTGATTPTITVNTAGTFSVTVSNGTCARADTVTISVSANPTPNLGPNQTVCFGTPVNLNPGSFSTYVWSTGATTPTLPVTTSGTYSVTVTNATGCTGNASASVTFNPLPTFSLGNDTFICTDTSIVLSGIGGMSTYIWSNGTMAASTQVTAGGTYMLTVTDANGCVASDTILIQGLTDCVFPGDANYDLVADNQDILSIGAFFGRINAPRANASTQWYGQSTPDWGSPLPLQADPKHSDCDGDGIVDYPDTAVVHLNYGRTHSKASGITTGGAALRVVALQDSVLPGDIAIFQVMLGDANAQVDSVYGFAFRINYTQGVTAAPSLMYVDYSNCWFAPASKRIGFTEPFPANATADLAVVRNDQQQRLGFGEICRFGILTDANMSATSAPLQVWLTQAQQVDAELGPHALEPFADSVVVSYLALNTDSHSQNDAPSLYPNPATNEVHLVQKVGAINQVRVLDATGRLLQSIRVDHQTQLDISTSEWTAGLYFLEVTTDDRNYIQKLIVRR